MKGLDLSPWRNSIAHKYLFWSTQSHTHLLYSPYHLEKVLASFSYFIGLGVVHLPIFCSQLDHGCSLNENLQVSSTILSSPSCQLSWHVKCNKSCIKKTSTVVGVAFTSISKLQENLRVHAAFQKATTTLTPATVAVNSLSSFPK